MELPEGKATERVESSICGAHRKQCPETRKHRQKENGKDESTKIRAVYLMCKDFMQVVWDKQF